MSSQCVHYSEKIPPSHFLFFFFLIQLQLHTRQKICWQFSPLLQLCVGVRASHFLLSGLEEHEAETGMQTPKRDELAELGPRALLDCFAFPLEYIGYTRVAGPACVHTDTHSRAHTHAKPQSDHVQFAG